MKKPTPTFVVLIAAATLGPCFAGEPLTLERLKELAVADAATPEGEAYLKQFFTNQLMLGFEDADEHCRAAQLASGPKDRFVIAMSIGANGFPSAVLVSPDDAGMTCEADRLAAYQFIKPPHDGFAVYMPFQAVEPGTNRPLTPEELASPSNR